MLLEEFLEPLGPGQAGAAQRLGISCESSERGLLGKRQTTPDTALRLSRLEDAPQFWNAAASRLGSPSSGGARRLVAATVCYRQAVTRFGTTEPGETTRRAISELRRIGGLTWAELGQLFAVSPQRMHAWASGGTPDAVTEQHLLRLLDVGHAHLRRRAEQPGSPLRGHRCRDALRSPGIEEVRGGTSDSGARIGPSAPGTDRT